ncbi:hypothetical protein C8R46DRAFT_979899 [Mycena filopes]|nr:hypothetical protein C8R46DRAFT_979899 [Mycena filopes]
MTSPPSKRQRTEGDADAPITRSEIWYSDGSLVLQAQNTQFRVHWGVLTKHSPFFRDMQPLPQPPDAPTIEECPLLTLQDEATDVEYLLEALYSPTFLARPALTFPAVSALLRLGRKYEFVELYESAVERLKFENPTTLEEYAARVTGMARIVHYPALYFDIIALARENGLLSLLPCAYYCALGPPDTGGLVGGFVRIAALLDGIPRNDGTLASLAPLDLRRCLLGRDKMLTVQAKAGYICGWYRTWSPNPNDCIDLARCTDSHKGRLNNFLNSPQNLRPLVKVTAPQGYCAPCSEQIAELREAGRKRMWEELPLFFDLPPWSELTKEL